MFTIILHLVIFLVIAITVLVIKREAVKSFFANKWSQFKTWFISKLETFKDKIFHKKS
jgi:hypothetical protein